MRLQHRRKPTLLTFSVVACLVVAAAISAAGQTATGSISGTVADSSGAVVPEARVTITSLSSSASKLYLTTVTGTYAALALLPGRYLVSVQKGGFQSAELNATVLVGQSVNGNVTLKPASAKETVTVSDEASQVNTTQAVVGDVTTTQQIDSLPLNGRNFVDLAQLNPGVQIQDGANIDPTKIGFAALSVEGRSGENTRIEVDGIDVTDGAVGTSMINVSEDSIQEFQVAQSTYDTATSLTTAGAVNVISRTGSNALHGSGFYLYRSDSIAADVGPEDVPFDRNQGGFRAGGPIKRDRLFWFANFERTSQIGSGIVAPSAPFTQFGGAYPLPFGENMGTGRLDGIINTKWQAFYSFRYDIFDAFTNLGGSNLQPFANRNHTNVHTVGLTGTTQSMTHNFRFGAVFFHNSVANANNQIPGLPQADPGGPPVQVLITPGISLGGYVAGDQFTLQRNIEYRYDGSYVVRNHTLRWGFQFLNIPIVAFDAIYPSPAFTSTLTAATEAFANTVNAFGGGASNPLNYPLQEAIFGNGVGWLTERSGLGQPRGLWPAKRLAWYAADTWKLRTNLTISAGLHYDRDWGRFATDLPGFPQLEPILPGAGHPIRQPNLNFSPQLGVAWDPFRDGKTAIRAGGGLFYDDVQVVAGVFDRSLRLPAGLGPSALGVTGGMVPGSDVNLTPYFGQPIGAAIGPLSQAAAAYAAYNIQAAQNFNPHGTPGFLDPNDYDFNTEGFMIDPNFKTPRAVQANVGIQRQLTRTVFLSADYMHNTTVHTPLVYDVNHVGAANTFNLAAARTAIATTEAGFGCSSIDCSIQKGATISDFANNGLGSPGGGTAGAFVPPNNGFAFSGRDPSFGEVGIIGMTGRQNYNGLQVRLRGEMENPLSAIRHFSWVASYSLSRYNGMAVNADYGIEAFSHDQVDPQRYEGPTSLDRTHMFSAGGTLSFVGGLQASFITRIMSALPATLTLPLQCGCPAEIYFTDLTGDGLGGDILPKTNIGSFGHGVSAGSLNSVISSFNSSYAGSFTPAAQALISSQLFTPTQLQSLGAVIPSVPLAPRGEVGLDYFLANDLRLAWNLRPGHLLRVPETVTIAPTLDIFNVVNKTNFDPPLGTLSGVLSGAPGSVNGTTYASRVNRYGLGSGVFSQGTPRALEVGIRVSF